MKAIYRPSLHNLDYRLARKVSWGTAIICSIALICVVMGFVNGLHALEIVATILALLVSIACLTHIYQEHQAWYRKEQRLKHDIVNTIYHAYSYIPQKELIVHHLEETLQAQSSPLLRLETLIQYQQKPEILNAFVENLRQQQLDEEVLEDLGLNWESKHLPQRRLRA